MTIAAKHPYDAIIGQNVKTRRMVRKKTQTELGDHLEITFQQIQKYENGANRIGAGRLFIIAQFLECSVHDFFDGVGQDFGPAITEYRGTQQGIDLCEGVDQLNARTRKALETLVKTLS